MHADRFDFTKKSLQSAPVPYMHQSQQPLVAQLVLLRAIGPKGAWVLVKELFGWRRFANRSELAGCLGLAPTPYASGDSQIRQDCPDPEKASTAQAESNRTARLSPRTLNIIGLLTVASSLVS
uniref:transposase n=1 Tax=Variovorax brevis TaxID=3053503 RepID=UPI0033659B53